MTSPLNTHLDFLLEINAIVYFLLPVGHCLGLFRTLGLHLPLARLVQHHQRRQLQTRVKYRNMPDVLKTPPDTLESSFLSTGI